MSPRGSQEEHAVASSKTVTSTTAPSFPFLSLPFSLLLSFERVYKLWGETCSSVVPIRGFATAYERRHGTPGGCNNDRPRIRMSLRRHPVGGPAYCFAPQRRGFPAVARLHQPCSEAISSSSRAFPRLEILSVMTRCFARCL